jgi:hypothetical protein
MNAANSKAATDHLALSSRRGGSRLRRDDVELVTCQSSQFAPIFNAMASRSNLLNQRLRRLPHWLALVAVFVQLVASFGHIHAEDYNFLLRGHSMTAVASADGSSGGAQQTLAPDIACAVCASAQILGSGALPDSLLVQAPHVQRVASNGTFVQLLLIAPRHTSFSTRGPPLI